MERPSCIPAAQDGSFTLRNTDAGQGLKPSGSRRNAYPCRVEVAEERVGVGEGATLVVQDLGLGQLSGNRWRSSSILYGSYPRAEALRCCAVKSSGWQCTCECPGRRPVMWCAANERSERHGNLQTQSARKADGVFGELLQHGASTSVLIGQAPVPARICCIGWGGAVTNQRDGNSSAVCVIWLACGVSDRRPLKMIEPR